MRLLDRAGERALLVAEQLALEQLLGNRRAVDRDEPAAPCGRSCVCTARASSSLPVPLSPRISTDTSVGATFSIMRQTLQHRIVGGDQALERRVELRLAQRAVLLLQRVHVERAADDQAQHVGVDRLLIEVVGAERDGAHARCRDRDCRSRR